MKMFMKYLEEIVNLI